METNNIIKTSGIDKFYSGAQILSDVNLEVPKGAIYGFLGKNGAGKTTTLKIITGLIKPDSGECLVFDKNIRTHREEILARAGAIIETPGFYSNLTARENLTLFKSYFGKKDDDAARINECLELVELTDESKVFEKFSLGMKQRLGIAFALLNKPELLILDEPANGLDPEGIIKIRELIKNLAHRHNITIIISSHILSEIEQIATHIGIIDKGKLIRQGRMEELLNEGISEYTITVSDIQKAKNIVIQNIHPKFDEQRNEIKVRLSKQASSNLVKQLLNNDVEVYSLSYSNNLEELFFNLTSSSKENAA